MNDQPVEHPGSASPNPGGLLQKLAEYDETTQNKFIWLYGPYIYYRCRRYWVLSESEASQTCKKAIVACISKINLFNRNKSKTLRTWIQNISDEICIDNVSEGKFNYHHSSSSIERKTCDQDEATRICSDGYDEEDEKQILLSQAIRHLDDQFQGKVTDVYWALVSHRIELSELAKINNVSLETILAMYSQVLTALKSSYQDMLDDDLIVLKF